MMKNTIYSLTLLLSVGASAFASTITVNVENIKTNDGQIGCAIFDVEDGFPMLARQENQQWLDAETNGITCIFDGLEKGEYAISVNHDVNGNKKTDTNLFGIPKEAWGVSNNVRPAMRAPNFNEAKFTVEDDTVISITLD